MIRRSTAIGSAVSAGPSAATTAASATVATATPESAEDQLRVVPTASTIVSASTASTAHAKKTEIARPSSGPLIVLQDDTGLWRPYPPGSGGPIRARGA